MIYRIPLKSDPIFSPGAKIGLFKNDFTAAFCRKKHSTTNLTSLLFVFSRKTNGVVVKSPQIGWLLLLLNSAVKVFFSP